jgi:hypothetical protein
MTWFKRPLPPQQSRYDAGLVNRVAAAHANPVVRKGRNVAAGNLRGWGLEFSDLAIEVSEQSDFRAAQALATGRTLLTAPKLVNLYLIMKYGLNSVAGDIVEFGSYRGGSALFMAQLLKMWGSEKRVFACDTFDGMPSTDPAIDLHNSGDFGDSQFSEIEAKRDAAGLVNYLVLVKGLFEKSLPSLKCDKTFSLAHVDCDIYEATKYVLREVGCSLAPGAYVVLDDPLFGSCLGAMEACEEVYLHEKRLHAEQVYPHLVFRPNGT